MTSLDDLLWLYKMAIQYNLEAEKQWLKVEIDARLALVMQGDCEPLKEAA